MAFKEIDEQGNITMYQGDTGHFNATGLNTDKNYYVYFAIQDEDRNPIGNELMVRSNFQTIAPFYIDQSLSNLLKVGKDEEYHIYYYGIKVCSEDGDEDTMLIGNSKVGDLNTITVYPKKAEGR